MGNDIATARWVVPAAFIYNFAAQVQSSLRTPNMYDVAIIKNRYAFSPNPILIGVFFAAQMVLQLVWIRKFFTKSSVNAVQMNYSLIYMVGSVCTGGWLILWTSGQFETALSLVTFNFFLHINEIARLPPYGRDSALTHWVMKTTIGIGLLEILATAAVVFAYEAPPSTLVKILTGVLFVLASLLSDPIFGGCVVYDLVALYLGQQSSWGPTLGWFTAVSAAIVGLRHIII